MNTTIRWKTLHLSLVLLLATAAAGAAQAAEPCAQPGCAEVRTFTATVSNLRSSKQGANRVVSFTVRFQNKTDKPLTLGYVSESATIVDDKGNRYEIASASGVRAIGTVVGTTFDPKFTLQPKEGGDARFELVWKDAGKASPGKTFDLDLAVREIVATTADQFRLGSEHALHYGSMGEGALNASAPAATGTGATSAAAAPPAPKDPCAGASTCFNAGSFIAQVQQVTPSAFPPGTRHHGVKLVVRFTNISQAPIILGYKASTSTLQDNYGNPYYWGRSGTHDGSVQGIGYVTGRSADPQFTLSPGQSRNATFSVTRYNARAPIGTAFQHDLVISELELMGGQTQAVRTLRENSLSFANLTAGNFNVAQLPGAAGSLPGQVPLPEGAAQGSDIAQKAVDLFNAVKNKKPAGQ